MHGIGTTSWVYLTKGARRSTESETRRKTKMEHTLTQAVADYIQQRKEAKLEPVQKALDKVLKKSDDPIEIAEAKAEYQDKTNAIETTFIPKNWLTDAAKRAKQISVATHAAKFTHSDAKASSVLVSEQCNDDQPYVVTAKLASKAIDVVGNAAALDVARMLKLSANGETLIEQLQQDHVQALAPFADNSELLEEWKDGLKLALGDKKLSGHTLNKQIYFPIETNDQEYHLLCPLFSSALAHELNHAITSTRYGESKDIREARKAGKYTAQLDESFPRTAVQSFGGSKPQNISQLNSERHGQVFLLNNAPPTFRHQNKPPVKQQTIFNRQLTYKTSNLLQEFKRFLENLRENERNLKVRHKRDNNYIQPIISLVLDYGLGIQLMKDYAGWSESPECRLKHAHALWLDVYNPSETFQIERAKLDWLDIVANDFSHWLTKQLRNDKYTLSDIEHNYFKKLFINKLKSFERNTPKLGEL